MVMIELSDKNEQKRLQAFEILERYKVIVEDGFENGLIWEYYYQREDCGQEVCRIYAILDNVDLHRKKQWPDIYNFFIENMIKIEENFLSIKDVISEELKNLNQ